MDLISLELTQTLSMKHIMSHGYLFDHLVFDETDKPWPSHKTISSNLIPDYRI